MMEPLNLFKSALAFSHHFARNKVAEGDTVIDATCGRGHDTLMLARLVGEPGRVFAFDIQEEAINSSRRLLSEQGLIDRVVFIHADHAEADIYVAGIPSFCMFNLGYLPGGDHSKTTSTASTISAMEKMIDMMPKGGSITLVAYSGHTGGKEEVQGVRSYLAGVSQDNLEVVEMSFINQRNNPAHLFVATKVNGGTI